jgi:hypothetical protein
VGELLRDMEKAKGAPGNQHTGPMPRRDGSKTLADYGVTRKHASQWQRLANVPEPEFEAALAGETKPGLIWKHRAASDTPAK